MFKVIIYRSKNVSVYPTEKQWNENHEPVVDSLMII